MDTLYHYCSNETFLSILTKRSIWLSSLKQSNDHLEGRLFRHVISELAREDQLDPELIRKIDSALMEYENFVDGLGFCLSKTGDLLSQWRGYANNGAGICIGFSNQYFEELGKLNYKKYENPFVIKEVVYESEEQQNILYPYYVKLKKAVDSGALSTPSRGTSLAPISDEQIALNEKIVTEANDKFYKEIAFGLLTHFYSFKKNAFKEEKEWRLLSFFLQTNSESCNFRADMEKITPYRSIELLDLKASPINKVILGPKNQTPTNVVEDFLRINNFEGVEVTRSEASYR